MSAARRPAARRGHARPNNGRRGAARKPAARKPAARNPAARRRRDARRSPGPRTLLALLVLVLIMVSAMGIGPLQRFTAAADRVAQLETTRDALRERVDLLEDRKARLSDPEELELIARSELGLVKPGEVPFIVVNPDEGAAEQVRPQPPEPAEPDDGPWYRRLGRALSGLFPSDR